jgi:flagellar hook assembly protein FlgD
VREYDIAGKLVNTLASADQKPGYYNLVWNRTDTRGRSAPAGVYFWGDFGGLSGTLTILGVSFTATRGLGFAISRILLL